MSAHRPSSIEAARELADTFAGAWDAAVRTSGGFYRLEAASAVLRLVERLEKLDPGFTIVVRDALTGDTPEKRAARERADRLHQTVVNACWFVGGVSAALMFATLIILVSGGRS